MGSISNGKTVPHFPVDTPHGALILIPRNTTRILVRDDPTNPFTIDNTPIEIFEIFELNATGWQALNVSPQRVKQRRGSPRQKARSVPRATYNRLLDLLCKTVTTWAADHQEILWQAEGQWLRDRIDLQRTHIQRLEEEQREALAELRSLEARRHGRRGRGWRR